MRAPDNETLSRFGWTDKKEVRIPGRMYRSRAYIDLSHASKYILGLFMQRRTWYTDGKGRNARRVFQNKGLMFSYREAQEVWHIDRRTFRDSIEQLISHGFLKIEILGGTLQGNRVPTIYMLVDDWQHYGTELFIKPDVKRQTATSSSLKRYNLKKHSERKSKISSEDFLTRRVRKSSPERTKSDA